MYGYVCVGYTVVIVLFVGFTCWGQERENERERERGRRTETEIRHLAFIFKIPFYIDIPVTIAFAALLELVTLFLLYLCLAVGMNQL